MNSIRLMPVGRQVFLPLYAPGSGLARRRVESVTDNLPAARVLGGEYHVLSGKQRPGYGLGRESLALVQAGRIAVGSTGAVSDAVNNEQGRAHEAVAEVNAISSNAISGEPETETDEGSASGDEAVFDGQDAGVKEKQDAGDDSKDDDKDASRPRGADGEPLTDQELRQLTDLKKRDAEVKAHERAHLAAAHGFARGGAHYEYQAGPDGRRYAVGGEVSIDTSAERDPEATVRKMEIVRRAALAPKNPSAQDRRVAASASQRETVARREIVIQHREELQQKREDREAESEKAEESQGHDDGQARAGESAATGDNTADPGNSEESVARAELSGITSGTSTRNAAPREFSGIKAVASAVDAANHIKAGLAYGYSIRNEANFANS